MNIEPIVIVISVTAIIGIGIELYALHKMEEVSATLHEDLKRVSELENHHFGQDFTYQLWQEKKAELEKELAAMRIALEKATLDAADLQHRYVGLEKTLRDFKLQLRAEDVKRLDKALAKKVKKAPQD